MEFVDTAEKNRLSIQNSVPFDMQNRLYPAGKGTEFKRQVEVIIADTKLTKHYDQEQLQLVISLAVEEEIHTFAFHSTTLQSHHTFITKEKM